MYDPSVTEDKCGDGWSYVSKKSTKVTISTQQSSKHTGCKIQGRPKANKSKNSKSNKKVLVLEDEYEKLDRIRVTLKEFLPDELLEESACDGQGKKGSTMLYEFF